MMQFLKLKRNMAAQLTDHKKDAIDFGSNRCTDALHGLVMTSTQLFWVWQ